MNHKTPLPEDIEERLSSLGQALQQCSSILFAYLFGGAATSPLRPLSDADVAVYLDESVDPVEGRLEATGRILQTRRVICDRDPLRRHRFESLALREFFDFRLFERRLLARRYVSKEGQ